MNHSIMKQTYLIAICVLSTVISSCGVATSHIRHDSLGLKPRIVVLTDIAPADWEPDDMESAVRLMAYADMLEVEALITSGGWNSSNIVYRVGWKDSLNSIINAYEKDLPGLMKRSGQGSFRSLKIESGKQEIGYWPSADYMRSRVMVGSLELGQRMIGADNRSEGSDHIIALADESDERPIWILAWGGANTFAQAVWQVEQDRTPEEVKAFLKKFRVYTITDQDVPLGNPDVSFEFSSHQRLRRDFPQDLMFLWDESAWQSQNGIGASNWKDYEEHIQGHGNLGKVYPRYKWGVEGDTPSFLHVLPNGLNDPSVPEMIGWGGYFEFILGADQTTRCHTNHSGSQKAVSQKYERYFYPAVFNDFAARMDWAASGIGNRNPVVNVNGSQSLKIIQMDVMPGESVCLDACGTYDPDGDLLSFSWWHMPESGTWEGPVEIYRSDSDVAEIKIPEDSSGKTIHIICEVTDTGVPSLSSYRRLILNVCLSPDRNSPKSARLAQPKA